MKLFKNEPTSASFWLLSFFFKQKFYTKNVGFSRIRTRIDRVEGEHADHLTTAAIMYEALSCNMNRVYKMPTTTNY